MNEAALADLLTSHPNDICADKHLRVRTMPPGPPGPSQASRRLSSPRRESGSGRLA
jgi:hypothetical protein